MAGIHLSFFSSSVICLTILFMFSNIAVNGKSDSLLLESLWFKREKMTYLHLFFHDIVSGSNPTAVRVAQASSTRNSPTFFGTMAVMDDQLTETLEMNSMIVGRAQGIYTMASQNELVLLMTFTFVFTAGKYNGSTLSLLGRNQIRSTMSEIQVMGGTRIFQLARGYA
ncbi:dirigent protein 21-like [Telopea speciosissima]|uniref:dirigent protein 21-like n=1 Tax=Telopea speciosissima TaxID=54955 RepID=UPI001CC44A36|nr:dirigent protein 21-like [Telopea speciosissima]